MVLSEVEWNAIKGALPIGRKLECSISQHATFGFAVQIDGLPSANAVVLLPDYRVGNTAGQPGFPKVGSRIVATVLDHVDLTKQIRLRYVETKRN